MCMFLSDLWAEVVRLRFGKPVGKALPNAKVPNCGYRPELRRSRVEQLEDRYLLSVGYDSAEYATGLIAPTADELAWERENMSVVQEIELNDLGLKRLAAEQEAETVLLASEELTGETDGNEVIVATSGGLPSSVDNSTLQYFPGIRSQGSQGSCAAFSVTYYTMTYMTALARGWDASDPGDNTTKFSPKWTYNMVNGGVDAGASIGSVFEVLADHGAATWAELPYDSNYREWVYDDPEVWRNAVGVRPSEIGYLYAADDDGIDDVKTMLANGSILNFGTYIYSWQYKTIADDPSTTADDGEVGKQAAYWVNGFEGGHAMTVVGYNDDIWIDINGNGQVEAAEKGAFRIANNWGMGWQDGGFTWLSYDALKQVSEAGGPSANRQPAWQSSKAYWLTARESYTPTLLAEFTVQHAERNQLTISMGRADSGSVAPSVTWTPAGLSGDGGEYGFDGLAYSSSASAPAGTFVLDFTDLAPEYGASTVYFLGLNDTTDASLAGTLSSFTATDWQGNPLDSATNVPQIDADGISSVAYAYMESTLTDFAVDSTWISVAEGSSFTLQVKLAAAPSTDVTVTTSWLSSDSDLSISSGSTLVFTTGNWDAYQTVEIVAAQDVDDTNGTGILQLSASGLRGVPIHVTEEDDEPIYQATMDSDPGWTYEGEWEWGAPQGGGGSRGNADPASAATGKFVVGYNLAGDYAANTSPAAWLTTTAIDCSGYADVELRFERWLNVERPAYDQAYLEVSNNGVTWTQIWTNSEQITDADWTLVSYDISAIADDAETVYIRWGIESDGYWQFSGWNIDDVALTGTELEPAGNAPTSVDLVSAFDTGASDSDNSTYYDNSSAEAVLEFEVGGTIAGATVKVYADGFIIGTAIATGETTTVTTSGAFDLEDGSHAITACQAEPGRRKSLLTPELTITVDTAVDLPDVVDPVPNARITAVDSIEITLSEPVTGMDLSDLSLTLDGAAIDLSGATLTSNNPQGYATSFILGNLTTATEVTGYYELTVSAAGTGIADEAGNVLAANASGTWGKYDLVVEGTPDDDVVIVTTDGTSHTVEINGATVCAGTVCLTFYFTGGGGTDEIHVYGSADPDALVSGPDVSTLDWGSDGVNLTINDFDCLYAYGSGDDTVYLYDGDGADDLSATPTRATMDWSTGASAVTQGFGRIYAEGSTGDNATMTGDSAGGNHFYGYDTRAILSTSSLFVQASGFDLVTATAGGTTGNTAYLYDGAGDDDLSVTPTSATMDWSTGVSAVAQDFGRVYAYGSTGDSADITGDSAGGNRMYAYNTRTMVVTPSSRVQATGFEAVTVTAGGTTSNYAYLYGGVGFDDLAVSPAVATLHWNSGSSAMALGFARVYAYGGTEDNTIITGDGNGNARLYGYGTRTIFRASSLYVLASGFGGVTVNSGGGAGNQLFMYDTDGVGRYLHVQSDQPRCRIGADRRRPGPYPGHGLQCHTSLRDERNGGRSLPEWNDRRREIPRLQQLWLPDRHGLLQLHPQYRRGPRELRRFRRGQRHPQNHRHACLQPPRRRRLVTLLDGCPKKTGKLLVGSLSVDSFEKVIFHGDRCAFLEEIHRNQQSTYSSSNEDRPFQARQWAATNTYLVPRH